MKKRKLPSTEIMNSDDGWKHMSTPYDDGSQPSTRSTASQLDIVGWLNMNQKLSAHTHTTARYRIFDARLTVTVRK